MLHQDLYMAFIDFSLAFGTVNRGLLWSIVCKFGCPTTFGAMLQQFLTGMSAQVVMAGSQSSSFPVDVGVKQGCVLASIVFNLFLVTITFISHHELQQSDSVAVMVVSSTCGISRPKLTSSALISALQ